MYFSYTEKVSN